MTHPEKRPHTQAEEALIRRMDAYLSGQSAEATAIIKDARALLAAAPQAPADVVRDVIDAWDACGRYPDTSADIVRLDNAINALRAMSTRAGGV